MSLDDLVRLVFEVAPELVDMVKASGIELGRIPLSLYIWYHMFCYPSGFSSMDLSYILLDVLLHFDLACNILHST